MQISDGHVQLLQRWEWEWFATFTFREHVHPESADKKWRVWLSQLNRELYGPRWRKKSHRGVFWARGLEYQKRGVIHYHALLSAFDGLNERARRLSWMDKWKQLAGFAKIEPVNSQFDVTAYVSKYVAKGGEIDYSDNLGIAPLTSQDGQVKAVLSEMPSTWR